MVNMDLVRAMILERDIFMCQLCREKDRGPSLFRKSTLTIHHKDGNRNNNSLKNLVTVCDNCHLLCHNGNWKNKPISWNYINRYATETIEAEQEIE